MPRLPLIHIPLGLYSVVSKCNNNEFLFDADEKFEMYLQHLIECKEVFGFTLYDIVCLSNHVHELYRVPREVTIAQILQRVKGMFSQKFNKRFGRTGHFWKNKPFYRIVENETYAFNTMNYYHWNSVKAGLVKRPEEWPYSGYRFHILGERKGLVGKLLDPLPYDIPSEQNSEMQREVHRILKTKAVRYIGSKEFRKAMRQKKG
ncbi:MAG: hypothetical protein A3F82_04885 [Deltaproteobacteria bacterium RIFCSPLOWO2_12_FULL_44_12]|nr:MAG: hypothetical protein A2712_05935 [Deltaproteobacteria bacterium RIFCSPHIGHO2_01_FULL_43_49]OGQ16671.1 MAG: hypothetical protein A3D22_07060 [Deltaproteobacteria bacterium RIFCSPHIGHO2_02_FULL_44_53]OGQ29809.1 MAG: hypothetical protein A3D98_09725 [Deltaproteobacteria bacterium RIFCSPHIGHO2_12_FULL_44_21]OGQ33099.1 MAG: hypothetical protein A2979_03705 [Deltaproteobacteria bacterium RIFCSPLOWO2_01_FULL_45_74]OGQ42194.1 MAG: hypothetical protein A3I70_06010 [Deltaproteobacteria bacterium 